MIKKFVIWYLGRRIENAKSEISNPSVNPAVKIALEEVIKSYKDTAMLLDIEQRLKK